MTSEISTNSIVCSKACLDEQRGNNRRSILLAFMNSIPLQKGPLIRNHFHIMALSCHILLTSGMYVATPLWNINHLQVTEMLLCIYFNYFCVVMTLACSVIVTHNANVMEMKNQRCSGNNKDIPSSTGTGASSSPGCKYIVIWFYLKILPVMVPYHHRPPSICERRGQISSFQRLLLLQFEDQLVITST